MVNKLFILKKFTIIILILLLTFHTDNSNISKCIVYPFLPNCPFYSVTITEDDKTQSPTQIEFYINL